MRCLDPARPEFGLSAVRPDAELSAFDCSVDGHTLLLGDNEGNVEVADARAPDAKGVPPVNLHDRKLNTLHVRAVPCACPHPAPRHFSLAEPAAAATAILSPAALLRRLAWNSKPAAIGR